MSNIVESKRNKSITSRFSKENNTYESIQEYFSDLTEIVTINSGYTEKEFLDFLDIIEFVFKIENIKFDYEKINDLDKFLEELFLLINGDYNRYGKIGYYKYNPLLKTLSVNDRLIDNCQSVIYALYIEPFYSLKNNMNGNLWNYIAYLIHKEQSRLSETEFNGEVSSHLIDYKKDEIKCIESTKIKTSQDLEELEQHKKDLEILQRFEAYLKEFSQIKNTNVDIDSLNEIEKELYKIISEINSFDYCTGTYFMDDLELEQEFFERYIEDDTQSHEDLDMEYMQHEVCEKCYSGQYYLAMHYEDDIEAEYLQWINDAGNNCYWPVEFNAKIEYTKDSRVHQNLEAKNEMVNHAENFQRFNELIEICLKNLESKQQDLLQ